MNELSLLQDTIDLNSKELKLSVLGIVDWYEKTETRSEVIVIRGVASFPQSQQVLNEYFTPHYASGWHLTVTYSHLPLHLFHSYTTLPNRTLAPPSHPYLTPHSLTNTSLRNSHLTPHLPALTHSTTLLPNCSVTWGNLVLLSTYETRTWPRAERPNLWRHESPQPWTFAMPDFTVL